MTQKNINRLIVPLRQLALSSTALAMTFTFCPAALAQSQPDTNPEAEQTDDDAPESLSLDTITVKGELRDSLAKSLDFKRNTTVVSDGILGSEIGSLPDISIAETLERITGVTAERFKGGSAAVSVRGLGPFLSATFFNGREVTSGSDGRDVNFGQFPSELIGGAVVYKSQQASFIEGGIAGNIELQTLRPLDFGRRSFQARAQLGINQAQQRVQSSNALSGRYTLSYIDQFDTPIGDIGLSIGGQLRDDTAPEDFFTTSSTFRPCTSFSSSPDNAGAGGNCNFSGTPDAPTGDAAEAFAAGQPGINAPFFFVSNQTIFRALDTEDDREAVIGSVQWQPTSQFDVNLDFQYSKRTDVERRSNLVIEEGRREITPIEISETGALLAYRGESRIENQNVFRVRDETFIGTGLNVEWQGERLKLTADFGYSSTDRNEDEFDNRVRTGDRVIFEIDSRGLEVPALTFVDVSEVEEDTGLPFDLNNGDIFDDQERVRRRLEFNNEEIISGRFDASYTFDGFINSVDAGLRYSERDRTRDDGIDTTFNAADGASLTEAGIASRLDIFPVEDLFSSARTDGLTDGLTFQAFDPIAFALAVLATSNDPEIANAGLNFGLDLIGNNLDLQDTDIDEDVFALYSQANYEGQALGIPFYGNIGIRGVRTKITSVGISSDLESVLNDDGTISLVVVDNGDQSINPPTLNVETNEFWNVLPSVNLILEPKEDFLLRFAVYSAIARPDPFLLTAALDLNDVDSFVATDTDASNFLQPQGNPQIEPLQSVNFDISAEYYLTDDTFLNFAFYHKLLQTGITNEVFDTTVNIDGTPTPLQTTRLANDDDRSRITGIEVAAQHVFSYLPGPLAYFGLQAGYNFADTNFETPDPTSIDGNALADFTTPASIPGFSRHSGNVQVFWENDKISARLAYRARSSFFRPFRMGSNRFNGANEFLDFSMAYDVNDWLQLRFSALNLTDELNQRFRPTVDGLAETNIDGRRFFIEARAKF